MQPGTPFVWKKLFEHGFGLLHLTTVTADMQLTMASKQQIPGQLPTEQSGPSEPPFPSPQPGPSHKRSVPQDEEYYSKEKLRSDRYRTPIQRQQTTDDLNKLYTSLGTNMSGIRRDVRAREDRYQQVQDEVRELKQQNEELKLQNQKTGDTVDRLEDAMMQLVQPKASESAPPEAKAGGSKEVPIALESDVEEINPLREGETKPRRWSTEKPDPPKRQKSKPPKGKGVARSDPDDLDSSSSSDSSGGLGLKDSKKSSDEDSKLRWKRFDFSLDKENHLAGWANWELWSNALSLAMEEIGYEDGMKLGQLDQLRLAKAITKTCKRAPLELSQKLLREVKGCGMRLGTEEQITMFLTAVEDRASSWCKTIQSVLRQTDYSFQQLIDDFNSEFHDRSNNKKNNNGRSANARKGKGNNSRDNKPAWNEDGEPLCFNCGKYGHMAKDCPEPQKEKNGKGKKGKRGQNGGQRNNSGNSSQSNQSNSSRNTRSDTRSGGMSEEQFIPEGPRDQYRSNGGTFSAHIDEQQLQDLMQWYDVMIQKADTVASVDESTEATEAAAADCTDCTEVESPERPEKTELQNPKLQGTDCPELRLQATDSPELQAAESTELQVIECPEVQVAHHPGATVTALESTEVTEIDRTGFTAVDSSDSPEPQVTERTEPQVADCLEAIEATVVGSAMLLHVHSSMEDDRDKLLWDSGANVNITNSIGDFERDWILDIRSKGIHIMTGGGPVAATSIGTVKWPLERPPWREQRGYGEVHVTHQRLPAEGVLWRDILQKGRLAGQKYPG
ncbi:hypothetical protein DL765_007213 [Monosporascus sp. GIB2]|nr:hypothetical protein DL765_007213 [Monosporascus sp. GIB2]